jgi:hypothetical protein
MTDAPQLVVYQRTGAPGVIYGVPNGDLSTADWEALPPDLKREVKASALYAAVPSEEVRDPLGELSNEAFDKLSPVDKGARTRKANELREEAERLTAEQGADEEGD